MKTGKNIIGKMSVHIEETSREMWHLSQNANNRHLDSQTVDNVFLPESNEELCSSFTILNDARSTDQNQRQHFCAFDAAGNVKNQPQASVSAREAVDPDKYVTITDNKGVVKFKCARCGNAYKWRKSLNKHWKEKHGKIDCPNAESFCYALETTAPPEVDMFEDRCQPSSECTDHRATPGNNCNYFHSCVTSLPMQISRSSKVTSSATASQSSPTYVPSCYRKMKDGDGLQFLDYSVQKEKRFDATVNLKCQILSGGNRHLIPSVEPSISLNMSPDGNPSMQNYAGSLELNSFSVPSFGLLEGLGEWNNEGILDLSCKGHSSVRNKASDVSLTSDEKLLPVDLSLKSSSSTAIVTQNCFSENDPRLSASGLNLMTSTLGAFSPRGLGCFRCCVKFSSMAGLNQHFTIQHLDSLKALTSLPFEKRGNVHMSAMSRVLKNCCLICGVSFTSMQKLVEHYDREHTTIQPNPYQNSVTVDHQKSTFSRSVQNPIPDNFVFQLPESRLKYVNNDCNWTSADVQISEQRTYKGAFSATEWHKDVASNFISQSKWKSPSGSLLNNGFNETRRLSSVFDAKTCESLIGFPKFCGSGKQSSVDGTSCDRRDKTVIRFASELDKSTKGSSNKRGLSNVKINLPYRCDVCGFCARWPSEMNQHKKNHSSEKPFKCPKCSYRSKWKWDVGKHLKSCGSNKGRHAVDETAARKRSDDTVEQGSSYEGDCSLVKLWRTNSSAAELGKLSGRKNSCTTLKKEEEDNNYAREQCLKVDNDMIRSDENTDKSVSLERVKDYFCNSGNTDKFDKEINQLHEIHLGQKSSSNTLFSCSVNLKNDLMKHEEGDSSDLSGQNGHNCVAFGLIMDGCAKKFEDKCFNYAHSWNNQTGILKDNMLRSSGHCFGGITFPGGRLRCCFCDYEAISFALFHKRRCLENDRGSSLALSNFKGSPNLGTNDVCSHIDIVCDKERVKNRYFDSEFWKCLGLKRKL